MSLLTDLCRRFRREWPREGDVVYPLLTGEPEPEPDKTVTDDPTGYRHPRTSYAPSPVDRDQYRPEAISPHLFGGES